MRWKLDPKTLFGSSITFFQNLGYCFGAARNKSGGNGGRPQHQHPPSPLPFFFFFFFFFFPYHLTFSSESNLPDFSSPVPLSPIP
ncbi:unnamed protein product [Penicillium nalgiovense]|nr:unnamed protein product [Penicillium nalgiovense]